jgi:hypothetical protein
MFYILNTLLNFLSGMINEKELVMSISLMKILSAMDDKIAKFILDSHQNGVDIGCNYLDVVDNKPDGISYSKSDGKNRIETKVGRLIRNLLIINKQPFEQYDIDIFVNKYKSFHFKFNTKHKFILVNRNKIAFWYNEDNYYPAPKDIKKISLYNSCMRSDECAKYFAVYNSTDCVSLLCLIHEETNTLMARALVWKDIVSYEDGTIYTFMDRVYSMNSETETMMIEYAIKNGWIYKEHQSVTSDDFIDSKGNVFSAQFNIYLAEGDWKSEKKPYMDTFPYLHMGTKNKVDCYYLCNKELKDCLQTWRETDGGPIEIKCTYCDSDGFVTCDKCFGDLYYSCSECSGNGVVDCAECSGNSVIDCQYCNKGMVECDECDGSGVDGDDTCKQCDGTGKNGCGYCDGTGENDCMNCTNGSIICMDCEGVGKIPCDCHDGIMPCPECS